MAIFLIEYRPLSFACLVRLQILQTLGVTLLLPDHARGYHNIHQIV